MQLPRDVPALFFDDSRMGDSDRIRVSWPTKRVRRRRLRRVTACWIGAGSTKQHSTGCETQHVDRNMDEWRDLLWLWGRRCDARMRSISNAAHNGELENSIEHCMEVLACLGSAKRASVSGGRVAQSRERVVEGAGPAVSKLEWTWGGKREREREHGAGAANRWHCQGLCTPPRHKPECNLKPWKQRQCGSRCTKNKLS